MAMEKTYRIDFETLERFMCEVFECGMGGGKNLPWRRRRKRVRKI